MKNFFERYGFVALFVILVVFVLIMISPLGKPIRYWCKERWIAFKQTELYIALTKEDEIEIVQDLEEIGYFKATIDSDEEDVWDVTYRFKDDSELWSDWTPIYQEMSTGTTIHEARFFINRIEPGVQLEFKAEKTNSWSGKVTTIKSQIFTCQ